MCSILVPGGACHRYPAIWSTNEALGCLLRVCRLLGGGLPRPLAPTGIETFGRFDVVNLSTCLPLGANPRDRHMAQPDFLRD